MERDKKERVKNLKKFEKRVYNQWDMCIIILKVKESQRKDKVMSILSDHIEAFIKEMLEEEGTTDLQRNELANRFNCAPSQINYVLTTRFSPGRGYMIQSRRGGGGYIRVVRLDLEKTAYVSELIGRELGQGVNMRQAVELIEGLYQTGLVDNKVKQVLLAAVSDRALPVAEDARNLLRSSILKEVLVNII